MVTLFGFITLLLATLDFSASQRKISRNVAVGADVKAIVNFDCPEEFGYYPHPSDCTQYYVCVFGGALLESCTGGLMYSHELQTCDWPRNVGCEGGAELPASPTVAPSLATRTRQQEQPRTRFPPTPPPAQPSAIVTSRGQPRQLQHQQEIIKQRQQQQLYAEAEETLPPAEEVENERQQRVYRGQPSTVGQVQRDRDGLRHSNAIPTYSGRSEKIGVISFGTQQAQPLQQYSLKTDNDNDDLLTNDLTLRRRHKRQIQRSRLRNLEPNLWRSGTQDSFTRARAPLTLQPPPQVAIPYDYSQEQFQPFIPQYKKNPPPFPSHTTAIKEPYSKQNNFQYFVQPTPTRAREKKLHSPDNFSFFNIETTSPPKLIDPSPQSHNKHNQFFDRPDYFEYQTQNRQHTKNAPVSVEYSSTVNPEDEEKVRPTASEPETALKSRDQNPDYNEKVETSTYSEVEYEYFVPPDTYFHTKNKYEDIPNPFANPDFDFDKFLDKLRGTTTTTTTTPPPTTTTITTTTTTTTTPKPIFTNKPGVKQAPSKNVPSHIAPPKPSNSKNVPSHVAPPKQAPSKNGPPNVALTKPKPKPAQSNDYYYYYDDDDDEPETEKPKKYSSQIKPANKNSTIKAPLDSEYYYDDYETSASLKQNEKPRVLVNNLTKNGETKYSSKYQAKPVKHQKTAALPPSSPRVIYQTTPTKLIYTTPKPTFDPTTTKKPRTQRTTKPTPTTTTKTRGKQRQRPNVDHDTKKTATNRVEQSSVAPISTATATARSLYNSSQYNYNNDPYYAVYDDDAELYRDVDYPQQYNNNAAQNQAAYQQTYRRTPTPTAPSAEAEPPKRGNTAYIQNNFNQDLYQPSTVADYNEDNSYSQVDDQNSYRQQVNRQPARGDRNDLNYVEEATTTKRITTTTRKPTTSTIRTTTISTTQRTIPPKKSTVPRLPVKANENKTQAQSITPNTLQRNPGNLPVFQPKTRTPPKYNNSLVPDKTTLRPSTYPFTTPEIRETLVVVNKPAPFTLAQHLTTTEKPLNFRYITKPSRSTSPVSMELSNPEPSEHATKIINKIIVPTTYSPPKFFLKSILPKSVSTTTATTVTTTTTTTTTDTTNVNLEPKPTSYKPYKTLKAVRKLINPVNVNYELSATETTFESAERISSDVDKNNLSFKTDEQSYDSDSFETKFDSSPPEIGGSFVVLSSSSDKPITTTISIPLRDLTTATSKIANKLLTGVLNTIKPTEELQHYFRAHNSSLFPKLFRTTVEVPPIRALINDDLPVQKSEPDQYPDYKLKPFPKPFMQTVTKTDIPQNSSIPARISRVNTAIKSIIAFGGTRRQNLKCHENANCNDPKQRTSTRGRGSTHYSNGNSGIASNEVTVNINRGTPASRSRPTLKPSTSIVSKASEFIDIYKFPPIRPEPIYPQPQPDKTAAKCRKDVCLLPDCSCGGKEIPGDIPVEQVPQIVLLTFDDSVNDLNKGLYRDLFEKGRTNPNGCPIAATFYVSHEWTDYSQVQNLYADGHELASHTVSHSFGEQFSQKKWTKEVAGQREILSAYGGVHLEDVRGMRAPFLSVGGNKMFKMLYDSNFTYDSSMPIYENKPPSWPYTLDYKLFHDCMIPPCPTRSYPGVWEVPMVMWQDLNGGRCSMGDACSNPSDPEGVFKMLTKNFQRHYTTNRAPFGLFYHAAWFTQAHHKEGFINFLDSILQMKDVWLVTNWQAIQWVRDPTPTSRLGSFQPFQCDYSNRPKRCNNPKVCNLWHKSGVRYMKTCQPCPDIYPWTGNTGIRSSRIDNDIED